MAQPTLLEKALFKVKENGFKYTKKREALLNFLIKKNRYTAAREIYEHLNGLFPGLSYDTVYRNLREFVEIGIVEDTDYQGEMKFRFSCSEDFGHHHHFICTVCGKTKEIHMCPMDFFKEQLDDCEIEGHRFELYGRCSDCKKFV
ncbi:transcriptional repressor [Enterococcus florum]|uniref:Transcriptional repressor n=1 Tax=Enterococcus florum TaxID=2480627 RepID=A0A4P5P6D2_9ENTE|nr:Fur family transcriptional regulator [Enterococcus florum]GCF93465.1 transcriptional repressor [Enterococcus florum]